MRHLLLILLSATLLHGDDLMTKIIYRNVSDNIPPCSFGTKPKTLYRLDSDKSRTEEMPDRDLKLHGLIISNGKDIWMINLWNKTGKHIIDPGPTYNFYAPLVPPSKADNKPRFKEFEIGKEAGFMKAKGVVPVDAAFQNHPAALYEFAEGDIVMRFYVAKETNKPLGSEVVEAGKTVAKIAYDEYETALPPDISLFQLPAGLKITPAKDQH